jgi:D-ribose pyranose/furanose isomerase RbsD
VAVLPFISPLLGPFTTFLLRCEMKGEKVKMAEEVKEKEEKMAKEVKEKEEKMAKEVKEKEKKLDDFMRATMLGFAVLAAGELYLFPTLRY